MFIILRKSSVNRTLALAVLLIMAGLALIHPFRVQAAESNLFYLYPLPGNNPVQSAGLFWSEQNPTWGAYTLPQWGEIVGNKQFVIGVPEGYQINAAMLGNNLGKYIVAKLGKRIKGSSKTTGGKSNPKDSLTYEREILPDGIKEKVKVEIYDHFKNNDNFERYLDIVKKHLTDPEILPESPTPKPPTENNDTAQAATMLGGTLLLGGLALMAKVLLPLLL